MNSCLLLGLLESDISCGPVKKRTTYSSQIFHFMQCLDSITYSRLQYKYTQISFCILILCQWGHTCSFINQFIKKWFCNVENCLLLFHQHPESFTQTASTTLYYTYTHFSTTVIFELNQNFLWPFGNIQYFWLDFLSLC